MLVHEPETLLHVIGQLPPDRFELRRVLVEEMQLGSVIHGAHHVLVVLVRCPCEVVHILRAEAPGEGIARRSLHGFLRWITVAHLVRVLQHAGGGHGVGAIEREAHVEIAPHPVELAADVRYGMPAAVIVLRELRVPLRHAVRHALSVVAAASADLHRHLARERVCQRSALAREQGLRERRAQHRAEMLELHGLAALGHALHAQFAHLMRLERCNAVRHARVRVGNGA